MALTDTQLESILNDDTKRITELIIWSDDEDHSPAQEFSVEVKSKSGWPLSVKGRCNFVSGTLNYALIMKTTGRIYALDLGKDHRNPEGARVGEKHKHQWSERYRDKVAYVPDDITAGISDPVAVWKQFCDEARICHDGDMKQPVIQRELRLWR